MKTQIESFTTAVDQNDPSKGNKVINDVAHGKDTQVWKIVKNLMKKAKAEDEIGFRLGRTHWVLRKGNFSA